MAAKKRAVSKPIIGTCCSVSLTFLKEITQHMIVIMKAGMAIVNGRKPSCMCMFNAPTVTCFLRKVLLNISVTTNQNGNNVIAANIQNQRKNPKNPNPRLHQKHKNLIAKPKACRNRLQQTLAKPVFGI
jgi:hypothetical protein